MIDEHFEDGEQPELQLSIQLVPRSKHFRLGYESKSVSAALGNHRHLF
jgi:hypothetical protein